MSLNLDKSRWTRVKFGEVVFNVNSTVKDAEAAGIDRVIAMEHLDPGELRVQRWGNVADGTTFTRRVKPGQTLFGKRRAYQRKVAYAEFDAICSGDILTFQANEAQILPEFLPFLVQSDGFFAHALGTSAGSLSPRTNWTDLSDFEFELPPLAEQKRLAELLWTMEVHQETVVEENRALTILRSKQLNQVLSAKTIEISPLETLVKPDTSITYGIVQAGPEIEDGVPYIRVSDMTDGDLSIKGMKKTAPEIAARFKRSRVDSGDLVVALRGRTGLTLKVPEELDGANLTQGTARVAIDNNKIDPDFVIEVMNSAWMASEVSRNAKGSTFTELTLVALRNLPVPRLGNDKEHELLQVLKAVSRAQEATSNSIEKLRVKKSAILKNIFEGFQ
ncbi:restriction endonuclease subunit S [Deinococcus sp.]|uniref:restriction endonuclease subunit S n=1 Tax=Deinococcus sp. TaxID=47478 RepID=UPI0025BB9235|nr:restriction endonuclease subunit S [Deinococcus sp.]